MPQREESESVLQGQPWCIRLARGQKEREQSLALMIQENDPDVKRQEVEKILKLHQDGKLDLNQLLIAVCQGKIWAALLMVIQEDQTAILWPPACDHKMKNSDSLNHVQDLLVQKACVLAKKASCDAIQTTVGCDDRHASELFFRNGLPAVGTILFLQRPVSLADDQGEKIISQHETKTERLVPITQGISDQALGELVLKTYVGSADFPELQRHHSGARALLTHRLQGEYNPEQWFVIEQNGIQVGVLFFSYHCELNQWELTYLGIIPEHRGKGIARRVIQDSLTDPQQKECSIFLGVDARNYYAIRLYESLGFVVVSRQMVHAWYQQVKE